MDIRTILKKAIDNDASDIFIIAGAPLCFKVKGVINREDEHLLSAEDTALLIDQIYELKTSDDKQSLINNGEEDFSISLSKLGRFRVYVYYQRGTKAAVLRVMKFNIPNANELHIPSTVLDLAKMQKGLILITGSAGSGKSTTLACIIDEINKSRNAHIITIEDPIEYLHAHNKSIVSQREITRDTTSYLDALRAALREAPNVILVGEMRDLETIQIALRAAETGHLVLSTLHTVGAAETINRIIDVFPSTQQQQIRVQLAMVLQAVVSQQLIPTINYDVHPAFEIMLTNNAIKTQIRENKLHQIDNTLTTGKSVGMKHMDDSIIELYNNSIISKEDALIYATNPDIVEKKID